MSDALVAAIASPDGQRQTVPNAFGELAAQVIGARLITLMAVDPADGSAERIYTNMPGPYPLAGRKPMNPSYWSRHVIVEKRTFVANTIEAIAEVFPDHPLILSLGCESVINLPIVVSGQVLGSLNALGGRGFFTTERIAATESLRLGGVAVFLLHSMLTKGTA